MDIKKQDKKKIIFSLIIVLVLILLGLFFLYLKKASFQIKEGAEIAREVFDPTTKVGRDNSIMRSQINEIAEHEDAGDKYLGAMDYKNAINEYNTALELSIKYVKDEWVPRILLSRVYEYSGQYDLASKELFWLISKKPRKEVADELYARRDSVRAALRGDFNSAALYAKKVYELRLENTKQFYLRMCVSWPKDKALKHVNEKIEKNDDIKRYYDHWKHLESLAAQQKK